MSRHVGCLLFPIACFRIFFVLACFQHSLCRLRRIYKCEREKPIYLSGFSHAVGAHLILFSQRRHNFHHSFKINQYIYEYRGKGTFFPLLNYSSDTSSLVYYSSMFIITSIADLILSCWGSKVFESSYCNLRYSSTCSGTRTILLQWTAYKCRYVVLNCTVATYCTTCTS